jgi:methylated-DNA-[protein]-cysteine S-methyltransferase
MEYVTSLLTPIGNLLLIATERGLETAVFTDGDPALALKMMMHDDTDEKFMTPFVQEFKEYFAGTRREFTFPLDLKGTDFQIATYYALRNVSYGETRTYGQIADLIGRPGAARAVGTACHSNPLAVVIPCHRVVAANGIGGYGFGLPTKRFLLRLEGCKILTKGAKTHV